MEKSRMMGVRFPRFIFLALTLCALTAGRASAYVAYDRWNVTATNGNTGAWGTATTVTWSFAPDGTSIPSASSSLISFLNANFGNFGTVNPDPLTGFQTAPWFPIFDQAFGRLSALSGVTYVYEPHDDGAAFSSGTRGILGTRGDARLSAKPYPDLDIGQLTQRPDPTLAANYFPDYSEMMINTNQIGYLGNTLNNYRRFRNVLMHEAMHGLGVSHVFTMSGPTFLMAEALSAGIDGPQLDDVLALHRLYGDVFEKNGGNDVAGSATSLGALSASQSLVRGTLGESTTVLASAVDFLSIDDASDADFFSFTLANPLAVSLALTPKGATYMMGDAVGTVASYNSRALSDLSLALFDASGTGQIGATANSQGAGFGESIVRELNAGTYFARVKGAQNDVQLYQLAITGAVINPDQLTWAGATGGVWNLGTAANFHNGTTADVFRNGDSVTFGGSAGMTVTVSQAVAPAAMTIQASGNYNFVGSGGITVNGLVVKGGGAATLGNNGNNLNGIDVQSGSLTISGAGNAPLSGTIRVAGGASLALTAAQSFAAASQITGDGAVTGDVTTPGAIAPGDGVGMLTFADDLTLTGSSVLTIELGGLVAGAQYDVLAIGGQATLNGGLTVSLVNGYQPTNGAEFSILTAGNILGTFATQTLPNLSGGLVWQTTYLAGEVLLSISAGVAYDPADFNEDGHVDVEDLAVWRLGMGTATGALHTQGDANGDFAVNGDDFLIWQRRLNSAPPVAPNSTGVPEPATWALALAAIGGLAGQVRRGRSPRRR